MIYWRIPGPFTVGRSWRAWRSDYGRHAVLAALAAFAVAALPASAASPATPAGADTAVAWHGSAAVRFTGTSTLHQFEGTATSEPFELRRASEPAATATDSDATASAAFDADVVVAVAGMDTDNGRRDERMREMLHAERCPTIRARLRGVEADAVRAGARLPLELEICEHALALEAVVERFERTAERVALEARLQVSLSAFALEAPRVLFVQVGDVVDVVADVVLEQR
jgi:hypothetical protein